MDVHRTDFGNVQHFLRQNLPESGGDAQVGGQGAQILHPIHPDLFRLEHGNTVIHGADLHGAWQHFVSPAFGLVRLGEHAHHLMARFHQGF